MKPRKEMILTIEELREHGFKTAAITNNWKYEYDLITTTSSSLSSNIEIKKSNYSKYDMFRQKGKNVIIL